MLSPQNAVRALLAVSLLSTGAFAQSVTIVSGNRQAAQQSFLTNDPLVVVVKNAQGQIVQNTPVQWTVAPSPGCPPPCNTTGNVTGQPNTDSTGQASTFFVGAQILQPNAFSQSLVTASALGASASFTITTIGSSIQGLPFVQILLDYPTVADTVTGPAGGAGATPIRVRVLGAGATSQANQGIPGVGVSIASENPGAGLPSISCVGSLVFTDASGTALCTPQFGSVTGSGQRFTVSVGGQYRTFPSNAFTVTAGGGGGQFQTLQCYAVTATPPVVRAEGIAEFTGDMLLNCTGGIPTAAGAAVPQVNIQIVFNTNVTSQVLSTSGGTWLESLLLIDEPLPASQFACETATGVCPSVGNGSGSPTYYGAGPSGTIGNNKNVFQGQLSGTNGILFLGVPFDPPGPLATRVLRIANSRVNASALAVVSGSPTPVIAAISAVGTQTVPIGFSQQTVAAVQKGLSSSMNISATATTPFTPPALQQCAGQSLTQVGVLRFQELFATAFRKRNPNTSPANPSSTAVAPAAQNNLVQGVPRNSETGFYNPSLVNGLNAIRGDLRTAGLAAAGTRLKAVFNNIPNGLSVYVDTAMTSTNPSDSAVASANESGGWFAVAGNIAALTPVNGAASFVWEVMDADSLSLATLSARVYVNYNANVAALGAAVVGGSYAPVSQATQALPVPVPRFIDSSTAQTAFSIAGCSGCSYTLSPTSQPAGAQGGPGSVGVITTAGCAWSAQTNVNWITITGGASGPGSGTVSYNVQANGGAARSGTLTIAGQTFTVTQSGTGGGGGACVTITTSAASHPSGVSSGTVVVSGGTPFCSWTAVSNVPWLTITAGASGTGNVSYAVAANPGASNRSGTLTIDGQTFTVTQLAGQIGNSPFFVNALYLDLLSRGPDAGGLTFYVDLLNNGAARQDIAYAIFSSAEFSQAGKFVISMYVAVLGRDPDFGGWLFWLNNVRNGAPPNAMAQQFILSPEFAQTYGSPNNTQFVQLVYQNVLGRVADAGGLNYWVGQLNLGLSRGDMMYAFAIGAEFQTRVNNRALADLLYLGFLRRTPEPAGQAFWLNQLNNGLAGPNAIYPFITSAEYLARF